MADIDEQTIREVFDKYDVEKECNIKTIEIVNALTSLQFENKTQDEVDNVLRELGISGQDITFDQFRLVVDKVDELDQKAELKAAFQMFDKENTGSISYAQLAQILKPMMGNGITPEELDGIVKEADTDNSGTIEIDEFVEFLSS